MKVAILAGGLATRLQKYYPNTIKSLIEFDGVPFVLHQLALLRKKGLTDVVICSGHGTEELSKTIATLKCFLETYMHMRIQISEDGNKQLGTGGAIKKALPLLGESFMTLYGDSYLDFNYQNTISKFLSSDKLGLMTIYHNKNSYDKSNVEFDGNKIISFNKGDTDNPCEYIDYGANFFHAKAFDFTPEQFDLTIIQQRLILLDQLDYDIISKRFYEIGSIEGIREFEKKIRRHRGFTALF